LFHTKKKEKEKLEKVENYKVNVKREMEVELKFTKRIEIVIKRS